MATNRASGGGMDPFDMLREDHDRVIRLFGEYERAGHGAHQRRRSIADQVFAELELHDRLEREIFYPAIRARSDRLGTRMVDGARHDHETVVRLIGELRQIDVREEEFDSKFRLLAANVRQHAAEEETELFPEAEAMLEDDEVEQLGSRMRDHKTGPQPRS